MDIYGSEVPLDALMFLDPNEIPLGVMRGSLPDTGDRTMMDQENMPIMPILILLGIPLIALLFVYKTVASSRKK